MTTETREPIMQFFSYAHLPPEKQAVSKPFGELAELVHSTLPRNPERSVALRKLLEAKDAAVRAGFMALLALVVFLPSLAFAQEAIPTPLPLPAAKSDILSLVLQYVVAPALPVLGALVVWALKKLGDYLTAKSAESKGALVALKLTGAAQSVVAELNATLRPQLEAALADGVLTEAEKKALKEAALTSLKTKLPAELMGAASGIFGSFLDTHLSGLVEQAVLQQKAVAGVAARPLSP